MNNTAMLEMLLDALLNMDAGANENRNILLTKVCDVDPSFSNKECGIILECMTHFPDVDFSKLIISSIYSMMVARDSQSPIASYLYGRNNPICPLYCHENNFMVLPSSLTVMDAYKDVSEDDVHRFIILHEMRHLEQMQRKDITQNWAKIDTKYSASMMINYNEYLASPWEADANGFAFSTIANNISEDLKEILVKQTGGHITPLF